jgi:hypothetical protein
MCLSPPALPFARRAAKPSRGWRGRWLDDTEGRFSRQFAFPGRRGGNRGLRLYLLTRLRGSGERARAAGTGRMRARTASSLTVRWAYHGGRCRTGVTLGDALTLRYQGRTRICCPRSKCWPGAIAEPGRRCRLGVRVAAPGQLSTCCASSLNSSRRRGGCRYDCAGAPSRAKVATGRALGDTAGRPLACFRAGRTGRRLRYALPGTASRSLCALGRSSVAVLDDVAGRFMRIGLVAGVLPFVR